MTDRENSGSSVAEMEDLEVGEEDEEVSGVIVAVGEADGVDLAIEVDVAGDEVDSVIVEGEGEVAGVVEVHREGEHIAPVWLLTVGVDEILQWRTNGRNRTF